MQPKLIGNHLKKLIQASCQHQILNVDVHSSLQYGPLGSLLKRNIFNEWLYSLLKSNDIFMFPVEVPNPRKQIFLFGQSSPRPVEQLLPVVLGNFVDVINSFGCPLPFGLAVYGPCVNENSVKADLEVGADLSFLSNLKAWTRMSGAFFCPSKKPTHWFHYWSKQRYLWWRKFSSIPSKFSLSEVVTTSDSDQQLSITLESLWGKDPLETITLHRDSFFSESLQQYMAERRILLDEQFSAPAIVTCEAELDLAVLAYLSNSYAEKWRNGQTKNVFHLHYKLAPYKVCISLEKANGEDLKKLKNVASHLTKELKATGISVFPTSDSNFQSFAASQFERFDEMGIPYVIVLNESSLLTGVAGLRNRDTTLQEQVHIADLTSKLMKYLKIKA